MIKELWGKYKIHLLLAICFFIAMEFVIFANNTEKFRVVAWTVVLIYGMIAAFILVYYGFKNIASAIKNNKKITVLFLICAALISKMVLDSVADQSLSTMIGRYIIVIQLMIIPVAVLGFMGIFVWKLKYWKLYLILGTIIGLSMMILIPIGAVPDEIYHINVAYRVSDVFLGLNSGKSTSLIRADDLAALSTGYAKNAYYSVEQLEYYVSQIFAPLKNGNLVSTTLSTSTTDYIYTIPALGIALGRVIGLGTYMTLFLGRLFIFAAFMFLTTYAIKIIPIGKLPLLVLMLMPMTVQQGMSYSYDVYVNGLSLLLIAYSVKIAYDTTSTALKRKDAVILIIASLLLFSVKYYAYFLISLLPWGILFVKRHPLSTHTKRIIKKVLTITIVLAIIAVVIWGLTGASSYPYKKVSLSIDPTKEGYSISYFIGHPFEIIYILCHTFNIQINFYINSFVGEYLGWLDIPMPHNITIIFLILLFIASIKRIGDDNDILPKYKKIIALVAVLTIGFICAGMLFSWSPVMDRVIQGVQGRYFIPCVALFLLVMRSPKIQIDGKADKYILAVTLVTTIYALEYLMIRY
jgi:uncharacterized membrane protein